MHAFECECMHMYCLKDEDINVKQINHLIHNLGDKSKNHLIF